MSLSFKAFPPAVIYTRSPSSSNGWGKARGPVVALPSDHHPRQLAHELLHVTQWWVVTVLAALAIYAASVYVTQIPVHAVGLSFGVMSGLSYVSPGFRFRMEAAGYGAAVRVDANSLDRYAVALAQSYGLDVSAAECRELISKRAADGRLI